jgi:hypothetical protein
MGKQLRDAQFFASLERRSACYLRFSSVQRLETWFAVSTTGASRNITIYDATSGFYSLSYWSNLVELWRSARYRVLCFCL